MIVGLFFFKQYKSDIEREKLRKETGIERERERVGEYFTVFELNNSMRHIKYLNSKKNKIIQLQRSFVYLAKC